MICMLCGSQMTCYLKYVSSVFTRGEGKQYDLFQCEECELLVTHPLPTETLLSNLYSSAYSYDSHLAIRAEKKLRAKNLLNSVTNEALTSPKSLIDLGCGNGELVRLASARGIRSLGVDLAAPEDTVGEPVFVSSHIHEYLRRYEAGNFDLVVMSHSLEHLSDPQEILRNIRAKVLSQMGQVILVVPNSQAWSARTFKKWWGYWQVPVHLHHFSLKSLSRMALDTGFVVDKVKLRGADSLFWVLTAMNIFRMTPGSASVMKMKLLTLVSWVLRYWMFIGQEDLIVVLRPDSEKFGRFGNMDREIAVNETSSA